MGSQNPLTSHLDGEEGVVDNLKNNKKKKSVLVLEKEEKDNEYT
jgi:hypothetical protein